MDRSDLAVRMKENYEKRARHYLVRRMPVAIRVDGKAFHSFTRGFKTPFDDVLIGTMQDTMQYMCEHIQGCVLGYQQSDEITLILTDYQTLQTDAWFDYNQSKLESISASMATMAFNSYFETNARLYAMGTMPEGDSEVKYINTLRSAVNNKALFDARAFNIPIEEVTNLILWRQQDAMRNSINMVGRAYFSDARLYKVGTKGIQNLLLTEKGIDWNDYPTYQKRGSCCVKEKYVLSINEELLVDTEGNTYPVAEIIPDEDRVLRSHWVIDKEIPIFVREGRSYIEDRINIREDV